MRVHRNALQRLGPYNAGMQLVWVSLSHARAIENRAVDKAIGRTTEDNLETPIQDARAQLEYMSSNCAAVMEMMPCRHEM